MPMKQDYLNRGKIAFLEDQLETAAAAFRDGDMAACETILEGIANFIPEFLQVAKSGGN